MGKHSKNNNDRAFFSHAERKAAAYGRHSSGMLGGHNTSYGNFVEAYAWGSSTRTLDKDAMKEIDACSLSLQPCADPVVTPQGVLYDKPVIFEYILARKKQIEFELKAWEAQQAGAASDAEATRQQAHESRIEEFVARQEGLSQKDLAERRAQQETAKSGASANKNGRSLSLDTGTHAPDTSFWVPQLTPQSKEVLDKPDSTVRCPITQQPLRLKLLFPVKFMRVEEGGLPDVAKVANDRFMCPLTKNVLNNVNPAAVLRPSGMVVSTKCVEKIIRSDMVDPFTDPPTPLKEKDIITLRNEGTGFAAKTDEKALRVVKSGTVPRF